ncbi:hypothetical protein EGW08_000026, partial [Elysia chlorotica]
ACPASCSCGYRPDSHVVDIVDCSNRGLTSIPEIPYTVREIYLQDNNILEVSCFDFHNLKVLTKLNLSRNKIARLPWCSFVSLASLKELSMTRCQLIFLDTQLFTTLQNLSRLDLSTNNLTKLQNDTFLGLDSLQRWDFSSNGIKCLGGPIYGMPSLKYLDISKNWSDRLNPLFFSELRNLTTLLLSQNRLGKSLATDIEGISFSNLALLEILDLSHNVIQKLSEHAFERNENLKVLNLSNNAIQHFVPSLSNNPKLVSLDLSNNPLEGFSSASCTQLRDIKL